MSKLPKFSRSNHLQRNSHTSALGWEKCSKPCPACPFALPLCQIVKGQVSDYEHLVKTHVNCQSTNVIFPVFQNAKAFLVNGFKNISMNTKPTGCFTEMVAK